MTTFSLEKWASLAIAGESGNWQYLPDCNMYVLVNPVFPFLGISFRNIYGQAIYSSICSANFSAIAKKEKKVNITHRMKNNIMVYPCPRLLCIYVKNKANPSVQIWGLVLREILSFRLVVKSPYKTTPTNPQGSYLLAHAQKTTCKDIDNGSHLESEANGGSVGGWTHFCSFEFTYEHVRFL